LKTYLFYYTLKQLQTISSKNAPKATSQSSSFAKAKKSSANLGTSANMSSAPEKSKKLILILTATTVAYAIVQQFAFSTLIDEISLRVVVFFTGDQCREETFLEDANIGGGDGS